MERESFEDEETARLMNASFVCIKLDREERPDIDSIYMEACQAMTGHGGWPLNAFLTPEQVPFYAGTYFPPEPRQGMPSWRQLLEAVAEAWRERRDEIRAGGAQIAERLRGGAAAAALGRAASTPPRSTPPPSGCARPTTRCTAASAARPSSRRPPRIEFLLRRGDTEIGSHTLRAMASGGMYDQVGGGFARYSVDERWLVPHFEKMLYDNALLARAYLHGWQVTGDRLFRTVCEETLDWALLELRGPEGGFQSALDADSEGVEGRFYVWTATSWGRSSARPARTGSGLGDRAGNFEGRTSWCEAARTRRRSWPSGAGPSTRCAPGASGRASTTSAWLPGTR